MHEMGNEEVSGWQDNPAWDKGLLNQDDVAYSGREIERGQPISGVLHRPQEIIVDAGIYDNEDHPSGIRQLLDRMDARDTDDPVARRLDLRRVLVGGDVDLVRLVRDLRELSPGAVALNGVVAADPQRVGGCAPPRRAARPGDIPGDGRGGEGITIAVLDTGIADPRPFDVDAGPDDVDVLEEISPGQLGPAVGHGTFVAGIVARHAPGAKLVVRRVLETPFGIADELQIAEALLKLEPVDIVNLSFGGFAVDDATMLTFERAVNALPRTTLVVAAAGNHGGERPHFSAAFKRVVAVGSAEGRNDSWWRADYSNHGGWVDGCAAGTDVHSTFVHFPGAFKGGAIWSGTSFAAPQLAASAAVLATRESIPVRLAAHRLIHDDRRPVVAGVGGLVDPNDLP